MLRASELVLLVVVSVAALACVAAASTGAPPVASADPISQALTWPVDQAPTWPTFVLDVGAPGDDDPEADAHLDVLGGVSEPMTQTGRTFRTISENRALYFRFDASELALADYGVPLRDAIVEVTYRDDVDEENCYRVSSTRAYCRPRLYVRLDYGANPPLEWHPLRAFAGLDDGEWRQEIAFLEGNPWQTLRAIDGYFELKIVYPNQEADEKPLPIDAISLRFPGEVEFDELREADRAARTLVRSEYVETNTLDPDTYSSPYVTYARNPLQKIYPNTVPAAKEIPAQLSAFEVPGEREPVTFALHAFEDLHDVAVRISDLVSTQGVIPAENAELQLVVAIDKRWMYSYDKYYGLNPWYLETYSPFDVPAGESRQVWITVDVPDSAAPGLYVGEVEVLVSGAATSHIPVHLRVIGVELAAPDAVPYVYHSPYMSYKHFAPRRSTAARDMAAHDLNPIIYLDAAIDLELFHVDFKDLAVELAEFERLGILPPNPRVGISDNVSSLWRKLCPDQEYYTGQCEVFDRVYRMVLEEYKAFFADYGVEPALSFTDEPGNDPEKRMRSNYLNRLTKDVGLRTWVTYYPRCEEPLAGHRLTFDDRTSGVSRAVPDWLQSDPYVRAHWDFEDSTHDRSPNRNDGELRGDAAVVDGVLQLPNTGSYMTVPHNYTLSFTDAATIYAWVNPAACHAGYARHPIAKWGSTDDANYVLYFFGDYEGKYPDNLGLFRWYANIAGNWTSASGGTVIDCSEGLGKWYNIVWTYDADSGGTMLVNGAQFGAKREGALATNEAALLLGRIEGALDDVLLLDRALTPDEQLDVALALNAEYDRNQEAVLRLEVPPDELAALPETLSFVINEPQPGSPALETVKSVRINGSAVWSVVELGHENQLTTLDPEPHLRPGVTNVFEFSVVNRDARQEDLTVYFVEDYWRRSEWSIEGADAERSWQHTYQEDESGSRAPMAPYLDDRVHAMRYVTEEGATATRAEGDTFSYYTTYPANQPVIVNNRFLNGIYASAMGAEGVYIYAYGDWGSQPWDDLEPGYLARWSSPTAQRSQGGYQLVLPAWQDRVYDTLVIESLREGIEDSRVIATLEKAIEEHPGPLAEEAQGYLDDLFARPSHDYSPRYMHSDAERPIHRYADRSDEILADLAGDPDAFGFFDETRRRMLSYISRLASEGAIYVPYTAAP